MLSEQALKPSRLAALSINAESRLASVIIDPWGSVIAKAPERESMIIAEIDLSYQKEIARKMPVFSHRVSGID